MRLKDALYNYWADIVNKSIIILLIIVIIILILK